jgi:hypothetical protein
MAVVSGDASLTIGGGGVCPMMQSGQLVPSLWRAASGSIGLPGVPTSWRRGEACSQPMEVRGLGDVTDSVALPSLASRLMLRRLARRLR